MSTLILVRHGQASFFAENYDKLSPLGQLQARQLGEHWLRENLEFDEIHIGPRARHVDTARIVGEVYRTAGAQWPEAKSWDDWDEHQVDQLVMKHADELARQASELKVLTQSLAQAADPNQKQRRFQRLFEAVAALWVSGHSFDVESWQEFCRRVNQGVDRIRDLPRHGRTVAVFTSVGPITVSLQRALACTDETALQTGWRLSNCSLTEFVFSGDRFTLDRFNALPHLQRNQWTYR